MLWNRDIRYMYPFSYSRWSNMSLAYSRISLSEVAHRSWRSTTSRERGHRHGESSSRDLAAPRPSATVCSTRPSCIDHAPRARSSPRSRWAVVRRCSRTYLVRRAWPPFPPLHHLPYQRRDHQGAAARGAGARAEPRRGGRRRLLRSGLGWPLPRWATSRVTAWRAGGPGRPGNSSLRRLRRRCESGTRAAGDHAVRQREGGWPRAEG